MGGARWRHWRPSPGHRKLDKHFTKGSTLLIVFKKSNRIICILIYVYDLCKIDKSEVTYRTKDELRFTFIFYIRTWSFFIKLVSVKKYITFLSKVRSSRHVMLSKIATPLSAQRLVWQASSHWQRRHEQRSPLCRGLNCGLKARQGTRDKKDCSAFWLWHGKHICSLDSFQKNLQTSEAWPLSTRCADLLHMHRF